ncbi:DUF4064 domain-containing protein [Bacillus sp. S14(2024)]|uniref:DUF4064 domain-containing protein n=1 Tax=Bacillus sp. S14(2024) TaxID=3162884 RepID=UPI003D22F415
MKRSVEFIIGLIGGILGLLISLFVVIGSASYASSGGNGYLIITSGIALIIQIGLLVLTCCVNKTNNIVYGICMIVLSVISLVLSLFLLSIPVVLQIISGALAFRTLRQESN